MVGGTAISADPFPSLRSASIPSISPTKSGLPPAASRIRSRNPASIFAPAGSRSISCCVSSEESGSSRTLEALSLPPPQADRRSSSSGRAMQSSRIGASRLKSAMCSTRSRKTGSPQCRSSNTTTSGPRAAAASKSLRTAQAISSGERACGGGLKTQLDKHLVGGRPEQLLDGRGHGPVADAFAVGKAAAADHRRAVEARQELGHEARFADDVREGIVEEVLLALPAHHWNRLPHGLRHPGNNAEEAEGRHRLGFAL